MEKWLIDKWKGYVMKIRIEIVLLFVLLFCVLGMKQLSNRFQMEVVGSKSKPGDLPYEVQLVVMDRETGEVQIVELKSPRGEGFK